MDIPELCIWRSAARWSSRIGRGAPGLRRIRKPHRTHTKARNTTTTPTYGWHGDNQRPTNPTTGLTTLGARTYNPTTGQFLTTDPIQGGNPTPYTYPTDPINQNDDTGLDSFDAKRDMAAACRKIGRLCAIAGIITQTVKNWSHAVLSARSANYREAARHFVWNRLLITNIGLAATKTWVNAHERVDWATEESRRDRRNNRYSQSVWTFSSLEVFEWNGSSIAIEHAYRVFQFHWKYHRHKFGCYSKSGGYYRC